MKELPKRDAVTFLFECDDLDKKATPLKIQGTHFKNGPHNQHLLWRKIRLYDRDSNHLVLDRARTNRKNLVKKMTQIKSNNDLKWYRKPALYVSIELPLTSFIAILLSRKQNT